MAAPAPAHVPTCVVCRRKPGYYMGYVDKMSGICDCPVIRDKMSIAALPKNEVALCSFDCITWYHMHHYLEYRDIVKKSGSIRLVRGCGVYGCDGRGGFVVTSKDFLPRSG